MYLDYLKILSILECLSPFLTILIAQSEDVLILVKVPTTLRLTVAISSIAKLFSKLRSLRLLQGRPSDDGTSRLDRLPRRFTYSRAIVTDERKLGEDHTSAKKQFCC